MYVIDSLFDVDSNTDVQYRVGVLDSWKKFFSRDLKINYPWTDTVWKLANLQHDLQSDGSSCGLFVMKVNSEGLKYILTYFSI